MTKTNDLNKRSFLIKICIIILIGAMVFLALILPLRGVMNALNWR